jgi:pyrimidine-nucleoside phosphorylase
MSAPLGRTVGNAIETREAIDVLRGEGPDDLIACTFALGEQMLLMGGVAGDRDEARAALEKAVGSGEGARVFERMIEAQGGDPKVVEDPARLPSCAHTVELTSDTAGIVTAIDALEVGLTAVGMGAGRARASDSVDHAVGIELCCERGSRVEAGDPLALLHVHAPTDADQPAIRLRKAFRIDPDGSEGPGAELVLARIGG